MRLECGCGYVAQGTSDEDVVVAAQVHARTAHCMELTAQQILAAAHEIGAEDVPRAGAVAESA